MRPSVQTPNEYACIGKSRTISAVIALVIFRPVPEQVFLSVRRMYRYEDVSGETEHVFVVLPTVLLRAFLPKVGMQIVEELFS